MVRWLGVGVLLLLLYLLHPILLGVLGDWVRLREPLPSADAILLLPGDRSTVPQAVADFYHQGVARQILLVARKPTRLERLGLRLPMHERQRASLLRLGIAPQHIAILGPKLGNEVRVGQALARWANQQTLRVLAVTAEPWGRSVRHDLRQGLGLAPVQLAVWSAPSSRFDKHWWRSRHGLMAYFDAFVLGLRRLHTTHYL